MGKPSKMNKYSIPSPAPPLPCLPLSSPFVSVPARNNSLPPTRTTATSPLQNTLLALASRPTSSSAGMRLPRTRSVDTSSGKSLECLHSPSHASSLPSLPKPTHPTAAPRPAASGRQPPSSAPPSSDSDATSANNTSTHANVACNITPAHPTTPPSTNSNTITHKKSTLIRRVTSKLHISIPSKSQPHLSVAVSSPAPRSPQSPPALPNSRQPRRRHSFLPPQPPTLPNSFVSREHREAALRERGLLPPRKDLSEQERERDARLPVVTLPRSSAPDPNVSVASKSLAEKIREEWIALNQNTDTDHVLPAYSPDDTHTFASTLPPATPNAVDVDPAIKPPPGQVILDLAPKSAVSQEQTFAPPQQAAASVPHITASRPSCSTSLPRLSTSLDVLPEEDDFEGPFTPVPTVPPPGVHVAEAESRAMTQPGIVISTSVDPSRQEGHDSPIKTMVEGMFDAACLSPLSCHGSGLLDVPPDPHSPRSGALDEQREDLPRPSVSSLPPRRHTTDTCDRPAPYPPVTISRYQPSLSPTTSSLSRGRSALGKVSSFSNLRRSVSTSFRSISTASPLSTALSRRSTETGADEVEVKIRTPVSPTMHNRASLWSEMRAIEDPECRRLCEMAFLD